MESNNYVEFTKLDSDYHCKLADSYNNLEIAQTMRNLQDKLYQNGLRILRKDNARKRILTMQH